MISKGRREGIGDRKVGEVVRCGDERRDKRIRSKRDRKQKTVYTR
jgi:hypothetical protein